MNIDQTLLVKFLQANEETQAKCVEVFKSLRPPVKMTPDDISKLRTLATVDDELCMWKELTEAHQDMIVKKLGKPRSMIVRALLEHAHQLT